jgi:hypothetical protein
MVATDTTGGAMLGTCAMEELQNSFASVIVYNLYPNNKARKSVDKCMYHEFITNETWLVSEEFPMLVNSVCSPC